MKLTGNVGLSAPIKTDRERRSRGVHSRADRPLVPTGGSEPILHAPGGPVAWGIGMERRVYNMWRFCLVDLTASSEVGPHGPIHPARLLTPTCLAVCVIASLPPSFLFGLSFCPSEGRAGLPGCPGPRSGSVRRSLHAAPRPGEPSDGHWMVSPRSIPSCRWLPSHRLPEGGCQRGPCPF